MPMQIDRRMDVRLRMIGCCALRCGTELTQHWEPTQPAALRKERQGVSMSPISLGFPRLG